MARRAKHRQKPAEIRGIVSVDGPNMGTFEPHRPSVESGEKDYGSDGGTTVSELYDSFEFLNISKEDLRAMLKDAPSDELEMLAMSDGFSENMAHASEESRLLSYQRSAAVLESSRSVALSRSKAYQLDGISESLVNTDLSLLVARDRVEHFVRHHPFNRDPLAAHTVSERRRYTRAVYDYARTQNLTSSQAEQVIKESRRAFRKNRHLVKILSWINTAIENGHTMEDELERIRDEYGWDTDEMEGDFHHENEELETNFGTEIDDSHVSPPASPKVMSLAYESTKALSLLDFVDGQGGSLAQRMTPMISLNEEKSDLRKRKLDRATDEVDHQSSQKLKRRKGGLNATASNGIGKKKLFSKALEAIGSEQSLESRIADLPLSKLGTESGGNSIRKLSKSQRKREQKKRRRKAELSNLSITQKSRQEPLQGVSDTQTVAVSQQEKAKGGGVFSISEGSGQPSRHGSSSGQDVSAERVRYALNREYLSGDERAPFLTATSGIDVETHMDYHLGPPDQFPLDYQQKGFEKTTTRTQKRLVRRATESVQVSRSQDLVIPSNTSSTIGVEGIPMKNRARNMISQSVEHINCIRNVSDSPPTSEPDQLSDGSVEMIPSSAALFEPTSSALTRPSAPYLSSHTSDSKRQGRSSSPANAQEVLHENPANLTPGPPAPHTTLSKLQRRKPPLTSPYFKEQRASEARAQRLSKRVISSIPFPPLMKQCFGLIQEKLAHAPFQLLVAVTFLNRTRGIQAIPVFHSLMERYPNPSDLAGASESELADRIRHLGLHNTRARRYIKLAKAWVEDPPIMGRRHRKLHYPSIGDGKDIKPGEILDDDDERVGAWEVAHLPTTGPYAIDSWRIFCRDELRGRGPHLKDGSAAAAGSEPEWMRVVPSDKELRAYLKWRWLKEGWRWNPQTGQKVKASEDLLQRAYRGEIDTDDALGMEDEGEVQR